VELVLGIDLGTFDDRATEHHEVARQCDPCDVELAREVDEHLVREDLLLRQEEGLRE